MSPGDSDGEGSGLAVQPEGWRRVTPSPSAGELKAFYAGEYFQASHGTYAQAYSETEIAHRSLVASLMLAAIGEARGQAAGGKLLEIGCGEGWFLSAADAAGYAVQGIDFSRAGLAKFHPQFLDRARFGDAFEILDGLIAAGETADVCVMEHVLEHVVDPEALLARLPRLLNPGGVLAITVPNDFSPIQLAARAAGAVDRDFWIAAPQHLNYFNAANLGAFLERAGFAVKLGFASFPIDWFLLHPGSNYVADPAAGKPAHRARMAIDLTLAEQGMEAYLGLAKALYACGAGRSLTVIASPRTL
ncbi:class I SAM-dependent methyltransferase [Phenylobacterium sp.]|uniref:class I SAM-dependent methyltransferase n=1 Tax=Phenylobacterium sp. TaxID=1871053 RepID=UPI002C94F748|nr:class I SAM-dependent methyltransferase [Phenylobacterium sp.]HLZ75709.1 class I SAM-dependent methyltransferase [Phenylobacterium sp.]